jgi:hypothetical protein
VALGALRDLALGTLVIGSLLGAPRAASAYSVVAHEGLVDAMWDDRIVGLLKARFPAATADEVAAARAFAYGGSVIQDLGYYPFGSHFFTNVLHYVRSGDFVETMVRESQTIDEYAFALGALAHYASDTSGHPLATNRAVPLMYPKVRAKYGDEVTYAQDPARHIMVEFSFDVAQIALGRYPAEAYHRFIGFEVAKPLLERAFQQTYGIEMKDVFLDEDLAIGSYRFAVNKLIPDLTHAAAGDKKDAFVYNYSRQEFEKEFGTKYQKPSLFARFLVLVAKILPKIGPFRTLAFEPPTPEVERLFLDSFARARTLYGSLLDNVSANRLVLQNLDFDTGRPTIKGEYSLADETYVDLAKKLIDRPAAEIPAEMRADVNRFFGSPVLASF